MIFHGGFHMPRQILPALAAALFLAFSPVAFAAAEPAAKKTDKAEKPAAFEAKAFFSANCASCHGADGKGAFGPDLRKVESKDDADITSRIKEGSPKGMPAFEAKLTAAELTKLTEHVKSL
jgi:cytochrome c oxidase cbb3-type subunit 3